MNINKRGYLMGIRETPRGTFTAVQGQHWYEFDMMGQILADHKLPRGFLDASHESIETVNGTVLLRVGKRVTAKKTAYMFILFVTKSLRSISLAA